MNKIIELTFDVDKFKASGLTHIQYLVLAYLRHDIKLKYVKNELHVLNKLEEFGYIRIIEQSIVVTPKTNTLFGKDKLADAREILKRYNELKEEHLKITLKHSATRYVGLFNRLLSQGHTKEFIENVLEYLFIHWKEDSFWITYLLKIDTIVLKFDDYASSYELSLANKTSNVNSML